MGVVRLHKAEKADLQKSLICLEMIPLATREQAEDMLSFQRSRSSVIAEL